MKESNTVTRTGLYINTINHTPHKQMKTECEIWGSFIFILPGLIWQKKCQPQRWMLSLWLQYDMTFEISKFNLHVDILCTRKLRTLTSTKKIPPEINNDFS